MTEIQRGFRSAEDESLFKTPTTDLSIVPDSITAPIEGYFRLPAVWVGEMPVSDSVLILNPEIHHAVVLNKILDCGIEARVLRDGTFLFDFSSWCTAPQLEIPGYKIPDLKEPYKPFRPSFEAEEVAEGYAVTRKQVMNVHQACLATSEQTVKFRSATMGIPLTISDVLRELTFDRAIAYRDEGESVHLMGRNLINNKDSVHRERPYPRRVVELDVVEHSLDLLNEILSKNDNGLIATIETVYLAACRLIEDRSGEAITMAWSVCEQLLLSIWNGFVNDLKNKGRLSKKRQDKLAGRDYTASVMIELLEINGQIGYDLYRRLEVGRKARNEWAHRMRRPKRSEVNEAIRALETLMNQVTGVNLSLQLVGPPGGVPAWNIWVWDSLKSE